jgi:hypothetical protein
MLRSFETSGTTHRITQRCVLEDLYYQSMLSEFQILQVLLKLKRRQLPTINIRNSTLWT